MHEPLTRRQEAILFAEFDSETYKLRSIDTFIAMMAGGEPMAVAIAKAAKPYKIAVRGRGTLKCVGALTQMYMSHEPDYDEGLRLLSKACEAAAKGWSGYADGVVAGSPVDGKYLNAVGMLVDAAGTRLDMAQLIKTLSSTTPKKIDAYLTKNYGSDIRTNAFVLLAAKYLSGVYNRAYNNNPNKKIKAAELDDCSLWATIKRTLPSLPCAAGPREVARTSASA